MKDAARARRRRIGDARAGLYQTPAFAGKDRLYISRAAVKCLWGLLERRGWYQAGVMRVWSCRGARAT